MLTPAWATQGSVLHSRPWGLATFDVCQVSEAVSTSAGLKLGAISPEPCGPGVAVPTCQLPGGGAGAALESLLTFTPAVGRPADAALHGAELPQGPLTGSLATGYVSRLPEGTRGSETARCVFVE